MIVCAKCGNANDSRDEFCGSCGAFLEWHGERINEPSPPVEEAPAEKPVEKPGFIDRVKYVVGMDEQLAQQTPVSQPHGIGSPPVGTLPPRENPVAMGPPVSTALPPPIPETTPAPLPPLAPFPPAPFPPPAAETRLPPVAPQPRMPVAPQPPAYPPAYPPVPPTGQGGTTARPPTAEYERPNAHRPKGSDLGPADLYCGSCAAGNVAGRRFCRSCGGSLDDATPAGKKAWWRRMFVRRRGLQMDERPANWQRLQMADAKNNSAGGGGGGAKKRFKLPKFNGRIPIGRGFGPVLMIAGLIGMGVPAFRAQVTTWGFNSYHSVIRFVHPEHILVTAKSVTANSIAKNKPAEYVIDRNPDTYWSEAMGGSGAGAQLTILLAEPSDLSKIGFDNGASGKEFTAQPRVKTVEVSYFDKDKIRTLKKTITVADTDKLQSFDLEGQEVASVTVKIINVYPGLKGSAASLREIALWRLK